MLKGLLQQLTSNPESASFNDVVAVIDSVYKFTPTKFLNGEIVNEAGENSGSCKIFAFAKLHDLTEQQTLHCFGDYYRVDVLQNPDGDNHQNIRNFMKTGWNGISFSGVALS